MKNILTLTSSFPRQENSHEGCFILDLQKEISEGLFGKIVLAPHFPGGKIYEQWNTVNIVRFPYFLPSRFERLAYGPGLLFNIKRDFFAFIGLFPFILAEFLWTALICRQENVILIHSHWLIPQGMIGAIFHKVKKIPHMATVHGSDLNLIRQIKILHPICSFIVRHSNAITVNSNYMKVLLESIEPEACRKIKVIPMGIDPKKFKKQNVEALRLNYQTDNIILSVGRLIDIKGTIYLINALPEVLRQLPNSMLLIVGDGPEREQLNQVVHDLGLESNIRFLGVTNHDEIPKLFSLADVFVMPSINKNGWTEALGVVLLEAMSSECAVIGSNVGGIPDIITDGENGFLVPEQNPLALADKIVRILSDNEVKEKFRKNGLLKVQESFTWKRISKRFYDVYSEILNESHQRKV